MKVKVAELTVDNVLSLHQNDSVGRARELVRDHEVHHVVVTHEKQIVGILSAFDLLKLVEEHRYTLKSAPSQSKRAPKRQ